MNQICNWLASTLTAFEASPFLKKYFVSWGKKDWHPFICLEFFNGRKMLGNDRNYLEALSVSSRNFIAVLVIVNILCKQLLSSETCMLLLCHLIVCDCQSYSTNGPYSLPSFFKSLNLWFCFGILVAILPWQVQTSSSNNNNFLFDCFLVLLWTIHPIVLLERLISLENLIPKLFSLIIGKYKYFTLAYKNAVLDSL